MRTTHLRALTCIDQSLVELHVEHPPGVPPRVVVTSPNVVTMSGRDARRLSAMLLRLAAAAERGGG